MPARRPAVVAYVAVSLDGATGFEPDVGRFYDLARGWTEDVTLAGAGLIPGPGGGAGDADPYPGRPPRPAARGRRRARARAAVGRAARLRPLVQRDRAAGVRHRGPPSHGPERVLFTGEERVDLGTVLAMLAEREDAEVVRVDSGGAR